MRSRFLVLIILTAAGCGEPQAGVPTATADVALLSDVLDGWQEGPTDGRLCLDPRVLQSKPAINGGGVYWSDSTLIELLRDTLVSIDTSGGFERLARQRKCAPTFGGIMIGLPRVKGDSAEIETGALIRAIGTYSRQEMRVHESLVRRGGHWLVVEQQRQFYPELSAR
jgi:hypothetical protein